MAQNVDQNNQSEDRTPAAPVKRKRRILRPLLLIVGPVAVIVGGAYWYYSGGRYVGTENAYIHADMVAVSPQVAGPITHVMIHENQQVHKGDVLFQIDPEPFKLAIEQAKANLDSVRQDLNELKEKYAEQEANLKLDRINRDYAQRTYNRQSKLIKSHVVSQAKLDESKNALDAARQRISVDKQALRTTLVKLGGSADVDITTLPQYQKAKAAIDQAELDLAHTTVVAPFDGVIGNKPEPGAYVSPGTSAVSLVSSNALWIDANFKEVDLTYVKPGQEVEVSVDTYPDHKWHGVVQSLSPATGAEFSVLPAQNATGNWVKVVQRIPVRIEIDQTADQPELRAGMSTEVEIDTHHKRKLPNFAQVALSWVGVGQAEASPEDTAQ